VDLAGEDVVGRTGVVIPSFEGFSRFDGVSECSSSLDRGRFSAILVIVAAPLLTSVGVVANPGAGFDESLALAIAPSILFLDIVGSVAWGSDFFE
jgi:hypothetical protein